jgi:hypothetical protein
MTPFQLHIYICEVELQCEMCLGAAKCVNEYFDNRGNQATTEPEGMAETDPEWRQAQLFRSLHSFLTHAAVVSRLLWPGAPRRRRGEDRESHNRRKAQAVSRGDQVRLALSLKEERPADQRALRDNLEHFDERLDDWVLNGSRVRFEDRRLGPPGRLLSPEQQDVMRWFDQTEGSFYFRGERFDLKALAAWIKEVRGLAAHARRYGPVVPLPGA